MMTTQDDHGKRLADALRANLRRRKAQARGIADAPTDDGPAPDGPDASPIAER